MNRLSALTQKFDVGRVKPPPQLSSSSFPIGHAHLEPAIYDGVMLRLFHHDMYNYSPAHCQSDYICLFLNVHALSVPQCTKL